jgi:branched-chain amino acid aminotransferase
VRANPGAEIVKMSAYHAGVSLDVLPRDPEATIAIAAFSVRDIYPGARSPARPSPASLQIADTRKMPPWVMSPQAKLAAGYLYTAVAKAEAREKGFDDVLLLDERGELAESSTQSFLLVESGTLLAPGYDYVLRGVTRRAVIDLARDEDIPVREEVLPRDLLERADEALLCGTTINVWPVARIDELKLPAPCPGPVTQRLGRRLDALLVGRDPLSARWIEPL